MKKTGQLITTVGKNMIDEELPILGIGNDIIEIERIRKTIDRYGHRIISRLFTEKEQEYCFKYKDSVPSFAGRFSVKEAVVKALGTGFGEHVSWLDIEVLNDPLGKPSVYFSSRLASRVRGTVMMVSISHCRAYVTATAVWVKKGKKAGDTPR